MNFDFYLALWKHFTLRWAEKWSKNDPFVAGEILKSMIPIVLGVGLLERKNMKLEGIVSNFWLFRKLRALWHFENGKRWNRYRKHWEKSKHYTGSVSSYLLIETKKIVDRTCNFDNFIRNNNQRKRLKTPFFRQHKWHVPMENLTGWPLAFHVSPRSVELRIFKAITDKIDICATGTVKRDNTDVTTPPKKFGISFFWNFLRPVTSQSSYSLLAMWHRQYCPHHILGILFFK